MQALHRWLPIFLFASAAWSQETGSIAGTVIDARTQEPLPEVAVSARSPALVGGETTSMTDDKGKFEMSLLPVGIYSLSIVRKGFQPFNPEGLKIKPRRIAKVRLQLVEDTPEWSDRMTPPTLISGPSFEYTPQALEREVEGTMLVKCMVNTEGVVRQCKVLQDVPLMSAAVIGALERRRYAPATLRGKPVAVWYTFSIRLKLPTW
jgi:hypothetical protein